MKRKTANIDIRVEPRLVERINAWRSQQRVPPSRSAAVVMLDHFLQDDYPELNAAWKRLFEQSLIPGGSQKCDSSHGIDRVKIGNKRPRQ
jgi:hypothetical protein